MFKLWRHSRVIIYVLALVFLLPLQTQAEDFSADTLKRMSVFLSNFTEIGMLDIEANERLNTSDPADLIRFGIWHNYINNYKSRVKQCSKKDCQWGSLTMECKYVQESLKRYFDYSLDSCPTVENSDPTYHSDGKLYHFEGADGEEVCYAKVQKAQKEANGQIRMSGIVYYVESKEVLGNFTALARPHVWKGKNTWAIISLKTTFKE